MEKTSKPESSELNQYKNPDAEGEKQEKLFDLYNGRLNSLVKAKLRPAVHGILARDNNTDFADNNYEFFIQRIIEAALATRFPKLYSNLFPAVAQQTNEKFPPITNFMGEEIKREKALTTSQIDSMKEKFPLQFQMVEDICQKIEERKSLAQIKMFSSL